MRKSNFALRLPPSLLEEAAEGVFGADIDCSMAAKGHYSPTECVGAQKHRVRVYGSERNG